MDAMLVDSESACMVKIQGKWSGDIFCHETPAINKVLSMCKAANELNG
jgi:hypothetical protein